MTIHDGTELVSSPSQPTLERETQAPQEKRWISSNHGQYINRAATLELPRIKPGQPAGDLVRAAFQSAITRIQAADPEARRGDPEGIHRLRTSTRRLRSELRTVRELVDDTWREDLERELKWLADLLGQVRDLDILLHRLQESLGRPSTEELTPRNGDPGPEIGDLEPFFVSLRARHAGNSQALRAALQDPRYSRLITRLQTCIDHPALLDEATEQGRKILPPLAARAWQDLKKGARALKRSDPDDAFHEVRKRAKRARYAAELIAPALGRRASQDSERYIRLTTQVQDVLGEHQDAIVAIRELERFLADHDLAEPTPRAARRLIEIQRRAGEKARDRFFKIWKRLDHKKIRRWMKVRHETHA
jgi:CHAD domain-containing protein